jgi:uncharacterized protein YndB with AHSA1/START domain
VTEILIDVDFGHPPERVWRALTDRAVLSEWFMRTDLEPYEGCRFRLLPEGLLGLAGPLEGELVEVVAMRKLVMLWRGEQLHSRVTWELVPLPEGCRLRMSHTGFIGVKGSLRRKELQRTYDSMLTDRLPVVLDGLAAGKPVTRQPSPAEPPPPGAPARPAEAAAEDRPGRFRGLAAVPHHRRGQLLAAAGAVLLAVLTAAVISGLGVPAFVPPLGADPGDAPGAESASAGPSAGGVPPPARASAGPTGQPAPREATASPGVPVLAPGVTGTAVPTPRPAPRAPEPAWRAVYRTVSTSASGFTGAVTVTNTSDSAASGWVVRITLPAGAELASVKRAAGSQSGTVVTFLPKNARQNVGPGVSTTLEFGVDGAGATGPTDCRVEGGDCTGVSG